MSAQKKRRVNEKRRQARKPRYAISNISPSSLDMESGEVVGSDTYTDSAK